MDVSSWTLSELADLVAAALADGGDDTYLGQRSGRVRDVPDRRAIRWYTTIGLVDRPSIDRDRTARYGPRQLQQIVAIKRLQAQGRSLAAIQSELAGADDDALAAVARVSSALLEGAANHGPTHHDRIGAVDSVAGVDGVGDSVAAPDRPRFWAAPVPAVPVPAVPVPAVSGAVAAGAVGSAAIGESAAPTVGPPVAKRLSSTGEGQVNQLSTVRSVVAGVPATGSVAAVPMTGIHLPGGAILLLPAVAGTDDMSAIEAAARPLIEVLSARGLLCGETSESSDDDRRSNP